MSVDGDAMNLVWMKHNAKTRSDACSFLGSYRAQVTGIQVGHTKCKGNRG